MKTLIFLLVSLCIIVSCDYRNVEVGIGIDSDLNSLFYRFSNGQFARIEIPEGSSLYVVTGPNWDKGDNFINNLKDSDISSEDSVRFINLDSTKYLLFVNPMIDDSVDFKEKQSAHFWNIDNWYATDNAVYYLLTEENFEQYAKEIQ